MSYVDDEEISLFMIGTVLLRNRRRLVIWSVVGALLAVVPVLRQKPMYEGFASFVSQSNDASRQGLAGLAGQLGVSLGSGSPAQSPEFYAAFLKSRALLAPIARDSFVVDEEGKRKVPLTSLLLSASGTSAELEDAGVEALRGMISPELTRTTGVVSVSVATQWPSVSRGIVTRILSGINEFNRRSRQTQAHAERVFVEGRLESVRVELRAAEDRVQNFMQSNKQFMSSPALTFERERLQRDLTQQQMLFTTLTSSFEDARIREARDAPAISVVESPYVPVKPLPRGRLKRLVLGLVFGGMAAVIWSLLAAFLSGRRKEADPKAEEFFAEWRMTRAGVLRRGPRPGPGPGANG